MGHFQFFVMPAMPQSSKGRKHQELGAPGTGLEFGPRDSAFGFPLGSAHPHIGTVLFQLLQPKRRGLLQDLAEAAQC
jgi:hypothetical protein